MDRELQKAIREWEWTPRLIKALQDAEPKVPEYRSGSEFVDWVHESGIRKGFLEAISILGVLND